MIDAIVIILALDTLAILALAVGLGLANREIEQLRQIIAGLAALGTED